MIGYGVKKDKLHFSYVWNNDMLWKDMVVSTKNVKIRSSL